MGDSRIKDVSALLEVFFDRETMGAGGRYVEFLGSWRQIAGPRLGDHSRPVDVRNGILIVEAEHSGWIQLLQMRQEQIVASVQQRYPELGVRAMALKLTAGERMRALPGAPDDAPEGAPNGETARAPVMPPVVAAVSVAPATPVAPTAPAAPAADLPPELLGIFERLRKNLKD
ncbi:MAG: DUF721 domain-containing protein [Rectinemataceae bacterium]